MPAHHQSRATHFLLALPGNSRLRVDQLGTAMLASLGETLLELQCGNGGNTWTWTTNASGVPWRWYAVPCIESLCNISSACSYAYGGCIELLCAIICCCVRRVRVHLCTHAPACAYMRACVCACVVCACVHVCSRHPSSIRCAYRGGGGWVAPGTCFTRVRRVPCLRAWFVVPTMWFFAPQV